MRERKLGRVQADVLDALRRFGEWHERCSWEWSTPSETRRILDSLVRAGYAHVVDVEERAVYRPTRKDKA